MSSGRHHEVATRAGRVKIRVWEESHTIIPAAMNLFCSAFETILILIPILVKVSIKYSKTCLKRTPYVPENYLMRKWNNFREPFAQII